MIIQKCVYSYRCDIYNSGFISGRSYLLDSSAVILCFWDRSSYCVCTSTEEKEKAKYRHNSDNNNMCCCYLYYNITTTCTFILALNISLYATI